MVNSFSLQDAFKKSCNNFEKTSQIFLDGLDPQSVINLYEGLILSDSSKDQLSELHIHFSTVSQQIMFDFAKSVLTLCQGHLADHYFYKRRSVEYLQLYAFIASSNNSRELCREYLNSDSTATFKHKDKRFEKWFRKEKSRYPIMLQAYNNACKYGTHAGRANQFLSQEWIETQDGFIGMTNYFDLSNKSFELDPFETAMIQIFRLYKDIYDAIFWYKLTPLDIPELQYSAFLKQLDDYIYKYKTKLQNNHPEHYYMIFEERNKK